MKDMLELSSQKIYIVDGALFHNGKILVLQRTARKTFLPLHWELPGGKVEEDETLPQAVQREFLEETGIAVEATHPYHTWGYIAERHGKREQCIVTDYMVTCAAVAPVILSAQEHCAFRWIAETDIDALLMTTEQRTLIHRAFAFFRP